MAHYIGILDGSGVAWGVRIPDLPGCHGAGSTQDEAIADAISAARDWVEHQLSRNVAIPKGRTLAEVVADPASDFDPSREIAVALPVVLDQGRSVKANISLDAGLLQSIDAEARRRGLTRSAFLAGAARDKILEN